jgi:hypothetical protein
VATLGRNGSHTRSSTVGVSLTGALIGRGLLRERGGAYLMGTAGAAEFGAFGIDEPVDPMRAANRCSHPK